METNIPQQRRPLLALLIGALVLVVIVYLSLPKSWFIIPDEKNKQASADRANQPVTLESLRDATQKTPLDYNARTRYGMILMANGKVDEAKEEFLSAARLAPESPIVHHNLGIFYMNSGEQTRADLEFQRELELAPGDGRAHYFRGVTLQNRKLYTEAKLQFELATKLASTLPETYLALASLETEKSPPEQIKAYIDTYVKLGGSNKGLAYHYVSRAYRTKQNYPEATRYAEMATKESPKQIVFWRNLGQIYSYSRRFDDADKTLRQVAEMLKDASPVYIEIGMNAQSAQRYPVAETAFQKALEISPQTGNIHLYLSRLYQRMGNKEAAQKEELAFREWSRKLVVNKIQHDTQMPKSP